MPVPFANVPEPTLPVPAALLRKQRRKLVQAQRRTQ
jgi:hypothetical protein